MANISFSEQQPFDRSQFDRVGSLFIVLLSTVCFIAAVLGGLYLFATEDISSHAENRDAYHAPARLASPSALASHVSARAAEKAFSLGPLHLGMTLKGFQKAFPSAPLVDGTNGETRAMVAADDAAYTLTFISKALASAAGLNSDDTSNAPAYRLTYRQTFVTLKEQDLTKRLGERFGRPTVAQCGTSLSRTKDGCRYTWILKGGIEVQARLMSKGQLSVGTTQGSNPVPPHTVLHIEATDTGLASKRARFNKVSNTAAATLPGTRAERLPF